MKAIWDHWDLWGHLRLLRSFKTIEVIVYFLGHLRPLWTFMSIEAIAVIWGHWGHFRQLRSFKAIIEVKMHLKSSLQIGLIKSNHPNIQAFLSQNGTLEYILVIHIFVGLKSSWKNLLFFTRFTLGFNSKSHNFPPSKKRRSLPLHKSVQWQEERCVITYTHLFFWRASKAPQAEKENGLYPNALPGRSKLKSFWIWTSSLLFSEFRTSNLNSLNFTKKKKIRARKFKPSCLKNPI